MFIVELQQRTGPGQRVVARAVLDCTGELAPLVSRGKDGLLNFLLPKNTGTGTLVRPRPILDFLGIHRFGRSFQFMYQNIRVRRDGQSYL